jgi:hypothetical protein
MTIATLDQYIAAVKEVETWVKGASITTVAGIPWTVFDQVGQPGAGALAIGNTAAGIVPVDTDAGYPIIASFGGAVGYFSGIDFSSSVACRIMLFDRLFAAGAYAFNADVTLAAQPSYAGRVPGAPNYNGLQIWVEHVSAFTLNPSFQINYLDQDGFAGDSGVFAEIPASLLIRRACQIPLAPGDSGVQQITRVRSTVCSAGTWNVMVLRPLWAGRVPIANAGDIHDFLRTGLPQIYDTSALYVLIAADSTVSGYPGIQIEIAH